MKVNISREEDIDTGNVIDIVDTNISPEGRIVGLTRYRRHLATVLVRGNIVGVGRKKRPVGKALVEHKKKFVDELERKAEVRLYERGEYCISIDDIRNELVTENLAQLKTLKASDDVVVFKLIKLINGTRGKDRRLTDNDYYIVNGSICFTSRKLVKRLS